MFKKFGVAVLAALIVLAMLAPAGVFAQDDGATVTFVPFTNDNFAISGIVPEGWMSGGPGLHVPGQGVTALLQQSMPGPRAQLEAMLLPQLALEALPELSRTIASPALTWDIYEVELTVSGLDLSIAVALAESESASYVVVLQTLRADYDDLYTGVFEPVVKALAPLSLEPAADAPYRAEYVSFASEEAVLAGTLTLPPGAGPHPAVILISGSGPQDRDESMEPVASIKIFRLIADHLTRQGIAVLRYDDRGVGASTGDFYAASTADLADDVDAAVNLLLERDDIDPDQIGLLGHSEGGLIVPMVAARNPAVAFVISVAGPAVPLDEVVILQTELLARAAGFSEPEIEQAVVESTELVEMVLAGEWDALQTRIYDQTLAALEELPDFADSTPEQRATLAELQAAQAVAYYQDWMAFALTYDPAGDWAQVDVPVLALYGGLDMQVDAAQSIPPLEAALAANEDVTIVTFPTANHLFQDAITGSGLEYGSLPAEFVPDFLPTIADWLLARVTLPAAE